MDRLRPKKRSSGIWPSSNSWVFNALLLTLVLCPLPFGSIYQWSWAGIAVIVGILLVLWSIRVVLQSDYMAFGPKHLWFPGLLYLLSVAWVALQGSGLTPDSWHHPIWQGAAETLGAKTAGKISLDPNDSESTLLQMLTYGGVFWLAAQYGRVRDRARLALWILGAAGALYALYGIVAELSGSGAFLWFDNSRTGGSVNSTFVNRSMYAVYAGFGFLCIASLFLDLLLFRSDSSSQEPSAWKRLAHEVPHKAFPLIVMAVLVLAALTLTGSRGGVFGSGVAVAVLFVCLISRQRSALATRRTLLWGAVSGLAIWVLLFAVAGAHLGSRLEKLQSGVLGGRLTGYELTLSAINEAPLQGFGAGSFRDVSYLYNDGAFWKTFNYSHNLYLGTAAEMGLPAAVTLIAAVGLVVVSCLRGLWRRRRDHIFPALGIAATAMVAAHGLIDSPLYIPANALTYSFLLGLAYAQSWPTGVGRTNRNSAGSPHRTDREHRGQPAAQSE